ncbi:MAG: HlyD family efflux transporter periplasmic adaptor subunit [Lentisphaerae bacterium]|nr:HlyD family efflux transporter periplasmic adaptor subunit [Lentisphaerota bacterium]
MKKLAFAATALVIITAVLSYLVIPLLTPKETEGSKNRVLDRFYTVKKSDMTISVLLTGSVNAQVKYKLALEAAFPTKLLWVVDENKRVKKGDVLAKFETEDLQIKIDEFKLNLQNTQKSLEIAIEEKRILESSNDAEIKTAGDAVQDALDAFSKYRKLEGPRDDDAQDVKVNDAKKLLDDAKDAYDTANDDFENTVYMKQEEADAAKLKLDGLKKKAEREVISHANSILERKIFKRFSYPNKLSQLTNMVAQTKLNLTRTKIKTASQLIQKENAISQIEESLRKIDRDLKKHQEYLKIMELVAPVDGIVTYGDPDNRRWGGTIELKIGMDVGRKQVLLTIPDMSKLIVEFDLPEQYRSKITMNDPVIITPDSLTNLKIKGKISKIALLPVNLIFWDRTSPKIYNSEVELDEQNPALVSGMSVQIEIITETLKDVMSVPIESVFEEEGKYFVYLKNGDKPKTAYVTLGISNDNYVHIKNGLSEGDTVYLYRPFQNKSN